MNMRQSTQPKAIQVYHLATNKVHKSFNSLRGARRYCLEMNQAFNEVVYCVCELWVKVPTDLKSFTKTQLIDSALEAWNKYDKPVWDSIKSEWDCRPYNELGDYLDAYMPPVGVSL